MRIKSFVYLLIATMIIAACDDDNKIGNDIENKIEFDEKGTPVYHVSIPASIDGAEIGLKFGDGHKIYLYNSTQATIACHSDGELITLTPTNISADSLSCILKADVTFYKDLWPTGSNEKTRKGLTIDAINSYRLLYGLKINGNYKNSTSSVIGSFPFYTQKGTEETAYKHCFAKAINIKMDVGENNSLSVIGQNEAQLKPMQSLMKFNVSFADENGNILAEQPQLKEGFLSSKNNGLMDVEFVQSNNSRFSDWRDCVYFDTIQNNEIILSVPFFYDNYYYKAADDTLTLTVLDTDIVTYEYALTTPTGGYQNGKYYSENVVLRKKPLEVKRTDVKPEETISMIDGHYMLQDTGKYSIYHGGSAVVEGYNVEITINEYTRVNGQIILSGSIENGDTCCSTLKSNKGEIWNPGKTALESKGTAPLTIIEESELYVNGNVVGNFNFRWFTNTIVDGDLCGNFALDASYSRLSVKGDYSNANVFTDYPEFINIQESDEDGYHIFYSSSIYEDQIITIE